MLGLLFLTLTVSAVVPLVPATVALLRVGRHAHVAERSSTARRARLTVAAAGLALIGLATAAPVDAGPVLSCVVAAALAGSVVAWSRLDGGSWAVRGVVVWALVVLAAVGLLGWVGVRVLHAPSAAGTVVSGAAWAALLLAMARLWRYARATVGGLARRDAPAASDADRPGPAAAALVLVAAAGVAVLAVAVTAPTEGSRPARAERGSSGDEITRSRAEVSGSSGTGQSASPRASNDPSPTRDGSDLAEPSAGTAANADAQGGPTATTATTAPRPEPSREQGSASSGKVPGYMKDKPNRPDKAPSPGSGNPHTR